MEASSGAHRVQRPNFEKLVFERHALVSKMHPTLRRIAERVVAFGDARRTVADRVAYLPCKVEMNSIIRRIRSRTNALCRFSGM